ncbi:N-acetylneuraminate synthase [Caenimonas sedimenti]|uniref:N-acetylneuraminate synthase n=1 Tax=Caenimonas sedimenti TaxID=2596921 RepID=A0A562ZKD6_9BURK|nr:N-acetylneuraminate synthase family protein [Caenimonas sedimenti]TWO68953.1 N-acetylneuraminate synthase [Caenimonas sedimenti]
MDEVRAGPRRIGRGQPCLIAAEVGINHNGDLDLALRSIDAAAAAGADAVKFQNYRTEDFLSDETLQYSYRSGGREVRESQFAMFKRCELRPGMLAQLKARCDARGVLFFSTPTGAEGIRELVDLGAPLIKNGSDLLTHIDVVRAMARSGLTTVLSTGMATLAEVDAAVRLFRAEGGRELVLLHCTSSYPTPPDQVNLRRMATLRSAFGCPVGFSDHSEGVAAATAAVALGACFVEKHFTLDRTLPGPDHWFSCDPDGFAALVHGIRTAEAALGDSMPGPTAAEAEGREQFRLSCTTAQALPAGTRLGEAHIAFRRPGTGIAPEARAALIGQVLRQDLPAGTTLTWEHFGHG